MGATWSSVSHLISECVMTCIKDAAWPPARAMYQLEASPSILSLLAIKVHISFPFQHPQSCAVSSIGCRWMTCQNTINKPVLSVWFNVIVKIWTVPFLHVTVLLDFQISWLLLFMGGIKMAILCKGRERLKKNQRSRMKVAEMRCPWVAEKHRQAELEQLNI